MEKFLEPNPLLEPDPFLAERLSGMIDSKMFFDSEKTVQILKEYVIQYEADYGTIEESSEIDIDNKLPYLGCLTDGVARSFTELLAWEIDCYMSRDSKKTVQVLKKMSIRE